MVYPCRTRGTLGVSNYDLAMDVNLSALEYEDRTSFPQVLINSEIEESNKSIKDLPIAHGPSRMRH